MTAALEAALRRHRIASLIALAALTALAWAWLLSGAGMGLAPAAGPAMPGMDMPGMAMAPEPGWTPGRFALTFAMWATMMVAMMLPSAAPTILLYARAAKHGSATARPPTESFLAGYLLAWTGFSLVASALQMALDRARLLLPETIALDDARLAGALLIAAGLYQLSPLKNACLSRCRNPAQFLAQHYRPGAAGALRMGLIHGAYCVGCCWLLMALLLVGGAMNLAWIAALTVLVAAEKLLPRGRWVALGAGVLSLSAGLLVSFGALG